MIALVTAARAYLAGVLSACPGAADRNAEAVARNTEAIETLTRQISAMEQPGRRDAA